ncbi:MAG: hypothetical protein GY953_36785, partial [bacterium]|nr:hypothetical protein [bacterium]
MLRPLAGILFFLSIGGLPTAQGACSAGAPLLEFQLAVQPDSNVAARSIRQVNAVLAGQQLVYASVSRRAGTQVKGEVSLVLVPSSTENAVEVLKPQPAGTFATWKAPFRTEVVALVYGPNGLDRGRVKKLVRTDSELITQLADYAEQTTKTEQLLDALAAWDNTPTATENVNSALVGFSSSYGRALPKLDLNAPPDQQFGVMLRALNPALATYDPLAPGSSQRVKQSALLASSVAGLFLGNPVGLAAGGAAMFVNLGDMLFPDTHFRSAFVQEAEPLSMTLCAKRQRRASRTKLAYFWAVRVPDLDPPAVSLAGTVHVPAGAASDIPLRVSDPVAWPHMRRSRGWSLVADGHAAPVPARISAASKTIELDLRQVHPAPGVYRLAGHWDWSALAVDGEVEVHALPGGVPELPRASKDRLVEGSGPVRLRMVGC